MQIVVEQFIGGIIGSFTAGLGVTFAIWVLVFLKRYLVDYLPNKEIIKVYSTLLPEMVMDHYSSLTFDIHRVSAVTELTMLNRWKEVEKIIVAYIKNNDDGGIRTKRLNQLMGENRVKKWLSKFDKFWKIE